MWPFSKRPKQSEKKVNPSYIPPVKECNHKYKDFPWYTEGKYNYETKVLDIFLKEPYVCIYCGHRKDVTLEHFTRIFYDFEKAEEFYESYQNRYLDNIQPKPVVEDMINDMVLVDQQYLDFYMQLHGERFKKEDET